MELSQTSTTDLALAWSSIFAAVGTVGAFVTGGWVLFRQMRRDRASDMERRRSQRRRQAELVAAWFGRYDRLSDRLVSSYPREPAEGKVPAAIVRNSSRLPIWDVGVDWVTPEGPVINETVIFATIPPEDEAAWEAPDSLPDDVRPYVGVAITFRDAAMVWWSRDQYGKLEDRGNTGPPTRGSHG